jgi:hypothetical protein
MKAIWVMCLLTLMAPLGAMAESRDSSWYVGAGFSAMQINDLCKGAPSSICDNSSLGLSIRGGWYVNRYFALEGIIDGASSFTSPAARAANLNGKTSVGMIGIGGVGFVPLNSKVSLLGGVSLAYAQASTKIYADGTAPRDCHYYYSDWYDDWEYYCEHHRDDDYESGGNGVLGAQVGIEVQPTRHVRVRAHAQRYFSVDGGLSFGQRRDVDVMGVAVLLAF